MRGKWDDPQHGSINERTIHLEKMVADISRPERCSAAKKVLEAVRDSPDLPR